MHIHILGICGTFMGGVAQLAVASGHKVTGSDANVYPPMSDQLRAAGIELTEGYKEETLSIAPDLWVIGNAVSRGNPLLEAILDAGEPYTSGPQWMSENILQGRHVIAVAGTHGKTTTTSLVTHILREAGLEPGYLVGGVPQGFGHSAELGRGKHFVIEADEYDTAFFDKRSKFVHYRPTTAVLNNLEFDHADIFEDLAAIEKQFHHLVRTIPRKGLVIANGNCPALDRVLEKGLYSRLAKFNDAKDWSIDENRELFHQGQKMGMLEMDLPGHHNALNALAALVAATDAGVSLEKAIASLKTFAGVKRRLEVKGVENDVMVIDDFAHHPTAIVETIAALRTKVGPDRRILAVLEPRSNTMKLGTMKDRLAASLTGADKVFCYRGKDVSWDPAQALASLGETAQTFAGDLMPLVYAVVEEAKPGDVILTMSNGGFGGICTKLLDALAKKNA
ncbi:MAG: UDP-N-acetylmuramate:L-alanyl-gamma-D-glutamyl-meso-diaminopimelate ligase [Sutterellaceae bacterium]|nr:UDP-N-acetylmuramate:L-alanyl-gamma-D-glutamyl-meso-diaminopimelate ligase [Sutterellaceae bacterium]